MSNPLNQPDAIWLLFRGQELLVKADDSSFPLQANSTLLPLLNNPNYHVTWYQEQVVLVTYIEEHTPPPEGYHFQHLRTLLTQINQEQFSLAGMASQVLEWAKSHRFCSRCGTATMPHPQGERALVCPNCQYSQYPRINPCVIVTISKDDTILLARSHRFNRPMYSLLAGFVEAGETLEQAVAREVLEEVGVQLKNICYFGSQAWPFPSNLMLGFSAEWASGELVLQEDEIMDAQFFRYNALPQIPPVGSIAYQLIHATVTELAQKYR